MKYFVALSAVQGYRVTFSETGDSATAVTVIDNLTWLDALQLRDRYNAAMNMVEVANA